LFVFALAACNLDTGGVLINPGLSDHSKMMNAGRDLEDGLSSRVDMAFKLQTDQTYPVSRRRIQKQDESKTVTPFIRNDYLSTEHTQDNARSLAIVNN
jgi:hypothetical protein